MHRSRIVEIVAPGAFYAAGCEVSRYHRAMLDDADGDAPASDLPDPERVYRNYLVTCRRLGVTPTPRDRAKALIQDWVDALAARQAPPAEH